MTKRDKQYEKYVERCKKMKTKPLSRYEWEKKKGLLTAYLGVVGGAVGGKQIKSMIDGRVKVYHGTRNVNIKNNGGNNLKITYEPKIDSIKKHGLLKEKGGTGTAAVDAFSAAHKAQNDAFIDADKTSKGTIHVSKNKKYADNYGVTGPEHERLVKSNYGVYGYKHPEGKEFARTFEINMPYDDFKKMSSDKKVVKLTQDQYGVSSKKAEKLNKTNMQAYQGPVDINRAAIKNNEYVTKDERKKYNKEQFSRYLKNHKGRFAGGLALGAAVTGATAYGAYRIIKNEREAKKAYEEYKNKGGKLKYREFKKKILNEFYEFAFENYDYITETLNIQLDNYDYSILNQML